MANIHGMGDFENNPGQGANRQQRQQMLGGGGMGMGDDQPDFIRGLFRQENMNQDPRKETFGQMLQNTFCPTLTKRSFITLITVVDSLVFVIITIASFFTTYGLNNKYFLGASLDITYLIDRYPPKIVENYQIYRLFTAIFLHTGFSHWIMNMITQIIFGSWLEAMVGFSYTAATYFISGILANVFAAVCQYANVRAEGASTAICGVIAGQLAMIIVNWSAFSGNPALEQMRCCFVAMCIIMIVMMVLMAGQSDILGHLGGVIFGLLFGLAFYPRPNTESAKKMRTIFMGLFTLGACLMIGLLFGLHAK